MPQSPDNSTASSPAARSIPHTTVTTASPKKAPLKKKHRSVKSLTREYEIHTPGLTPSSSATSFPTMASSPTADTSLSLPQVEHVRDRTNSQGSIGGVKDHTRNPSVLLASSSYPSTLNLEDPRPRALSASSSYSAHGRTESSVRLASPGYPSSYKPERQGSDGGVGSSSSRETSTPLKMHRRKQSKEKVERERQQAAQRREGSESKGVEEEEEEYEDMDMVGELGLSMQPSASVTSMNGTKSMTAAERREHSRRNSKVHAKNLSVFFPRPGTEAEAEAEQAQAQRNFASPELARRPSVPDAIPAGAAMDRYGSNATSTSSFLTATGGVDMSVSPSSSSKSRRGHHHRHSVNFAQFDQAVSPIIHGQSDQHDHAHSHQHDHSHAHDPSHANHVHGHSHASHASDRSHAVAAIESAGQLAASVPSSARPMLLFGSLHFALGAALWVAGQAGDSLAVTGFGYLVVFDAFGVLSEVGSEMAHESWRKELDQRYKGGRSRGHTSIEQIRRPYGPHRFETILHFSQSIYLLFSAIYVLKESIEHALLEGSEEHEEASTGLSLPIGLLLLATGACIFSNIVLKNHAKLVAACGISTAASTAQHQYSNGHARRGSVLTSPTTLAGPFLGLFANPFSLTVLFFAASLLFSAVFMPPFQVAALDKVLAGLESVSMFFIAYPASKALGLILLQTGPGTDSPQYVQLIKALQRVSVCVPNSV